ncbi:MAG: DegT/DnrJ/EryC1/StrS family aminotransferase [Betaproteobacteria bacterium]
MRQNDSGPLENRGPIPSFDLTRQNTLLAQELEDALLGVIRSGRFILGEQVEALEREIAGRCGVSFGIGVANGSDALHLALLACGVWPGDEVITTPFTFFATAGAIARAGARPVFCDVEPETYNIDPSKVAGAITRRTKAIIPVHLFGHPADMAPLQALAREHRLYLIEDAAQAIGAQYGGKPVGSLGDVACFSFFPTKNLGAFGDGGMVVTDNPGLADRVRVLRVHGSRKKYYHESLGYNSRLDELQAAVLRVKAKYLDGWIARRREIAATYRSVLAQLPQVESGTLRLPVERPDSFHVYHQFTLATPARDRLQSYLQAQGIGSNVYYPLPLHLQQAFAELGYRQGDFPEAERAAQEVLSLPMFPELSAGEIERVVDAIRRFFSAVGEDLAEGIGAGCSTRQRPHRLR